MRKSYKAVLRTAMAVVVAGAVVVVNVGCSKTNNKPSSETKKAEQTSKPHEEDDPKDIATDFKVSYDGIKTGSINAGVSVHDPSIYQDGDDYYIYGSHRASAQSQDLRRWSRLFDDVYVDDPIFTEIADEKKAFLYCGKPNSAVGTDDGLVHIWAPDIIYNKAMKKYCLYFCTSSNYMTSSLAFATGDSPRGPFYYEETMIYSGFNSDLLNKTNVLDYVDESFAKQNYITAQGMGGYDNKKYPNAIDPTVFYDTEGKLWMVYGSWSGGIFILELDESTGKPIHPEADEANGVDAYFGKRLIGGGHTSIEGPYIMYDEKTEYYYLYVSYGGLTSDKGYQIRVFRSKTPNGDYVDMEGKSPQLGTGNPAFTGLKLTGNYRLPSLERAYKSPGHNSAFRDEKDGKGYIVFHTRFEDRAEIHEPRVHQYVANEEGWPCILPYATSGETISEKGYETDDIVGMYYVVNLGMKVDNEIIEPIMLQLTAKGNVYGDKIKGTWEQKDGSCYMNIEYDGRKFSGVFCEMKDEADTKVMAFSAVGSNETVWGVKYFNED